MDETNVQVVLHVDAAAAEAADDDQHGTVEAPLSTLRFACRMAERAKDGGKGVKLVIAAGTYRESIEIRPPANGRPDPDVPLIIEAAERDQTIIDGADTEGWTPSTWKEEGGRWTHPWPFLRSALRPGSANPGGQPPAAVATAYRHGDLVIVNGTPMRQANALAELQAGSFWGKASALVVARGRREAAASSAEPPGGPTVFVQPPEEVALADVLIQVGVRPAGLTVNGRRNVVVRGLVFQHAAAPTAPASGEANNAAAGLVINACSNVLIEDVLSQWNDGVGLRLVEPPQQSRMESGYSETGGSAVTLRRVRLLHNGDAGLVINGGDNFLVEDCEVSFNNFRGEWAGWTDPQGSAGMKIIRSGVATWRRQRAVGNHCRGMWFEGMSGLRVEEAVVRDNFVSGILVSTCEQATSLRRCLVTGTKLPPGGQGNIDCAAAISAFDSSNLTLESNVVAANEVAALGVSDVPPNAKGLVKPLAENILMSVLALRHNVFYGRDATQVLTDWPAAERAKSRLDFTPFYGRLSLQENGFWNPESMEVFCTYDKNGHKRTLANLQGWQTYLAAHAGKNVDKESGVMQWHDPLFVDPAQGDFHLQESSPFKDWGLLVDEESSGQ